MGMFDSPEDFFKDSIKGIALIIALNFALGIGFIAAILCLVKVLFF